MFSCRQCEGVEYELVKGHYYCKTCFLLSQDYHEQTVVEETPDKLHGLIRQVKKKTAASHSKNVEGRPWTIYEAYQCIILAQCDALVSLGAKEDLKSVVYTIWANYLAKMEIAFSWKEKVVPDIVLNSGYGRRRELHSGTLDKPWNKPIKRRKKGSHDTENDYVRMKRKRGIDSDSDSSSDEDSTTFVKGNKEMKPISKTAEWMNLKKTVVFCFIGLCYTNPEIILAQFVRWIYDGRVPYMSTSHLLNPDMVLSSGDNVLFMPVPITVQGIMEEMKKVIRYMSIENIPQPNLYLMVKEIVRRLDLPDELADLCARLVKQLPNHNTVKNAYSKIECVAVRYIVLALKMTFGLDDNTENQLSEYSEEVQKTIGSEGNVFVWSEWRAYHMRKEKTDFNLFQDFLKDRKFKSQHLDEILANCKRFRKEDQQACNEVEQGIGGIHHETKIEGSNDSLEMTMVESKIKLEPLASSQSSESRQQKFTESTLTHLIDFDAFKNRFRDKVGNSSLQKVQHRREKIYKDLVYFNFVSEGEGPFYQHRPNSYSWLVQFVSNFIGFEAEEVDTYVDRLESRLRKLARKEKK